MFNCREEEREAIEAGITETKTSLQLEDIRLIQEFSTVKIYIFFVYRMLSIRHVFSFLTS